MRTRLLVLAVTAGLLAPSRLPAQHPPERRDSTATVLAQALARVAEPDRKQSMYEDVEILRRLIDRTFAAQSPSQAYRAQHLLQWPSARNADPRTGPGLFGPNAVAAPVPQSRSTSGERLWGWAYTGNETATDPHHALALTQGNYLDGYGAVFMVQAPLPFDEPKEEAPKPATRPLTAWETVRRELRGEKVEAKEATAPVKKASLLDALLRTLAENGQHLKQLGENEVVTIAVTFGNDRWCMQCHQIGSAPRSGQSSTRNSTGTSSTANNPYQTPGTTQSSTFGDALLLNVAEQQLAGTEAAGASKYTLLGDLHQKQGKYKEAIQAYEQALAEKEDRELYKKLAQCFLALSEAEAAQKVLSRYLTFASSGTAKKATPKAGAMLLPPRLVISANKKLLSQVGSGKMTFEEFKKAATVEVFNPKATETKP